MKSDIYKNIKTTQRSKTKIFVLILALLALIAIGVFAFSYFNKPKINYITQNPTIEDISQDVSATGSLSPTNTVTVGSEVSGTIIEVLVDVNDTITKGQILAKIDTEKLDQSVDNYSAQLDSAKAELYSAEVDLENKQWNYENYKDLFEKTNGKSPSQLELKNAELEYKSALAALKVREAAIKQVETELNSAKVDVQKAIIKSPTNGVVLTRAIEPGQTVAANYETPTLFEVAEDLTKMKLESSILEADIGKLKEGQEVEFSVDSYPNQKFFGKVDKVYFADSSSTSTTTSSSSSTTSTNIISYTVITYVDNSDLKLRPGMSTTATIKTDVAKGALVVPYQALLFTPSNVDSNGASNGDKKSGSVGILPTGAPPGRNRQKASYSSEVVQSEGSIWVLENGTPRQIRVGIGISNGKSAQILSNEVTTDMQVIIQSETSK